MKNYINLFIKNDKIKFVFSGAINTTITYLIYLILLQSYGIQPSYTIAYIFGILIAFFLNQTFVFNKKKCKAAVLFPLVYLAQYFFGVLLLWLFISICGLNSKLGPLIVGILSLPFTYFLSSLIFNETKV
jgi:putative flippase GtrA